jgi:hypothetical protein
MELTFDVPTMLELDVELVGHCGPRDAVLGPFHPKPRHVEKHALLGVFAPGAAKPHRL